MKEPLRPFGPTAHDRRGGRGVEGMSCNAGNKCRYAWRSCVNCNTSEAALATSEIKCRSARPVRILIAMSRCADLRTIHTLLDAYTLFLLTIFIDHTPSHLDREYQERKDDEQAFHYVRDCSCYRLRLQPRTPFARENLVPSHREVALQEICIPCI